MTALFVRRSTDESAGRLLASLPGTREDLQQTAKHAGASLGILDVILSDKGRHHAVRLAELEATLRGLVERVRSYRAARAHLPDPYDPEDPRCPAGQDKTAWFVFTNGATLISDLECLIEHLSKLAELGAEEIIVTGYD